MRLSLRAKRNHKYPQEVGVASAAIFLQDGSARVAGGPPSKRAPCSIILSFASAKPNLNGCQVESRHPQELSTLTGSACKRVQQTHQHHHALSRDNLFEASWHFWLSFRRLALRSTRGQLSPLSSSQKTATATKFPPFFCVHLRASHATCAGCATLPRPPSRCLPEKLHCPRESDSWGTWEMLRAPPWLTAVLS